MDAKWILPLILMLAGLSARADDLPIAPPPHEAPPPVGIAAIKGGYTISLNRESAELLRDALANADEKSLATSLRQYAKDLKSANPDDKSTATLELVAFVVSSQLPGFKKKMNDNIGTRGTVITLTGLQADGVKIPNRPRIQAALNTARAVMPLLPDDAKDVMEALRAVGRTTPLFWTVEPRD